MNNRRKLVIALGAGALVAPFSSFSQTSGKIWRIGFLAQTSGPNENIAAFVDGLRNLGYIEGRNLTIEYRWAAGNLERLPEMAAELVRLKVDLIATQATEPNAAAKRATSTIPIVMTAPSDPVGSGLVASLARPGGNVTGMSMQSTDLAAKDLQLVRELVPKATRVAVLTVLGGDAGSSNLFVERLRTATKKAGMTLVVRRENEAAALAGAFAAMQSARTQALVVQLGTFTSSNLQQIVKLTAEHRLPAIFGSRIFVDAGGLMSYGPSLPELYRRAAYYVDRIFKGAKPADLPVEQPTKFELVINRKTAKALGLAIPQSLLISADEVIE
jgi:putative ABC transport system substrate-binding protein